MGRTPWPGRLPLVAEEGLMAVVTIKSRTPTDRKEVLRRVLVYRMQVERYGHIQWLPNLMDPKVRTQTREEPQAEEQDD